MNHLAAKRKLWFSISAILLVPCIISLIFTGLKLGIDFTGGSAWQIQFDRSVDTEKISQVMTDNGFSDVKVQEIGDKSAHQYMIRTSEIQEGSAEKKKLETDLTKLGTLNPKGESLETVGASVGKSIQNRAVLAVAAASVGILLYIAYAFRNTQNPFLYGSAAIVAMLHDAIFVLGVFSIAGWLFDVEVDSLFITALLTIIGFSVHDTIVVFDRIRENLANKVSSQFEEVVNYSIAQTIVRSVNTSMTVLITLLALYLFGGASTKDFVFALLIGVAAGTYSSIFNASQVLVAWEYHEIQDAFNRIFRRGRTPRPRPAS
ncbi:MAG TPA: protein translocase subunit SecF [Thermomicrobiales bacterium]|nr:protein translocase subunit SecF [Thermomicrobiales bacterium]